MGRKKKEIRLKEPVRIREKNIAGGNISLYLDIYQKGLRKKETLKLYLVPEINATTKLQNANTRKLAEQIKAQRILDIQREGLVDWDKVKKSRMTLTKWMDDFVKYNAELSESSMKTKRNTHARIDQYLLYIGKPEFLLKDVDKEFCKGFITFLKTCTYNDGKKQLSTTTCRMFGYLPVPASASSISPAPSSLTVAATTSISRSPNAATTISVAVSTTTHAGSSSVP